HIINFSIPGFKPEVVIHSLAEQDIFISTKSACSSKQLEESRILKACGFEQKRASSALRVSMSYDTTKEDIRLFVQTLKWVINQLKDIMETIVMQYDHILIRYRELAFKG